MQRPERAHGQGQSGGSRAKALRQHGQPQRAPNERKQDPSRQHVNREVDRVVAENLGSADPVVERKREIEERPAADAGRIRRSQRSPERPELPNAGIAPDRGIVVEQERDGEGLGVGRDNPGGERGGARQSRPIRLFRLDGKRAYGTQPWRTCGPAAKFHLRKRPETSVSLIRR